MYKLISGERKGTKAGRGRREYDEAIGNIKTLSIVDTNRLIHETSPICCSMRITLSIGILGVRRRWQSQGTR